MKTCSICGNSFLEYGNNPAPLKEGVCCDKCNREVVLPLRRYLSGADKKTILVIEPNDALIYVDAKSEVGLKELQTLVGGYIELYPYDDEHFDLLVDEEGILKRREPNRLAKTLLGIDAVGSVVMCPKGILI